MSEINESKEDSKRHITKKIGFQIGMTIFFSVLPITIFSLFRMATNIEISKIYLPIIAFPLQIFVVFFLFPQKFHFPFDNSTGKSYTHQLGINISKDFVKLFCLGLILGVLSLSGMLVGSYLSGVYQFNPNVFTWEQFIFATVPGVWEEIYYRGLLTFILLKKLKDKKKAIIIQSIIFGLVHFYSFSFWAIIDLFSIMIMGLIFAFHAKKANSLIPSIIFHFLHDAFNYVVQVPESTPLNNGDKILFFGFLWIFLSLGALLTFLLQKKGVINPKNECYYNLKEF